jgi:hypothetical protein
MVISITDSRQARTNMRHPRGLEPDMKEAANRGGPVAFRKHVPGLTEAT